MKLTQKPHILVFASAGIVANIFLICAYVWGPLHTPKWVSRPYAVVVAISIVIGLAGELKHDSATQTQ